jgi:DNA processing protein
MSTCDEERLARVILCRIADPGDVKLGAAIASHGAAPVVRDIETGKLTHSRLPLMRDLLHEADPQADLETAERAGARFVCPGDLEWPSQLADLARIGAADTAEPFGLWVRGSENLRLAALRAVAVVGARAATSYGEYVATELAAGLTSRAWTVVSGGAFGIDGAAHRGALAGDGMTVAVLACGVDVPYPRGHTALLERIASRGLLVSECPPGSAPMRHRFLVRNRIIAALTRGTVVVEAALRSGARSTANRARDMSRHVMVVPGPVTSAMSAGCHAMLRDGEAQCVTNAQDVIELVGALGADLAAEDAGQENTLDDELDATTRAVLQEIPTRGGIGLASLALHTGLQPHVASSALGMLYACGLVERADGGWRRTRGRR